MNIPTTIARGALALLIILALPASAANAQTFVGTAPKAKETPKKAAPKQEEWKTPGMDTTGMNFKGRKETVLAVATDDKGKLTKADIAKSSGDAAFDKKASDWAMKSWGGPKSVRAKIPVIVGQ